MHELQMLARTRQSGHTSSRCLGGELGRRGSWNGPVTRRRVVATFFNQRHRLKSFRRNEDNGRPLGQDEWRDSGSQDQCKGIERPRRRVIIVGVVDTLAAMFRVRGRNNFDMRVEVRVDQPRMIVIRSRTVARVNVLERGQ